MHRSFQTLSRVKLAVVIAAALAFTVGCGGGGGGSEAGNRAGTDTAPKVIGLQTPSGLQGTRGVDPDNGWVSILYSIQDREYDWCQIAVDYGYDHNGDGIITDGTDDGFGNPTPNEFAPATPAPEVDANGVKVHDGLGPLNSSPGAGALHAFTWDSVADIGTKRFLTQDYVYTEDGRIDKDLVTGDIRFELFPGVVLRIKPSSDGATGSWAKSDGMSVNNNNTPSIIITGADIPPEGADDGTVNEKVAINWTAVDPDSDSITITVDIAVLEDDSSYLGMSDEELAELPWVPATTADGFGEGTFQLSSTPNPGVPHKFGWDSLADLQQQRIPVLVRIRPLDGKREQGDWVYAPEHLSLDNYSTFMAPTTHAVLPEGRVGAVATTLDTGHVLVTGGSSTGDMSGLNGGVVYYVLDQNPYGNVSPTKNTLEHGRTYHTATRLLAVDPSDPNDDPAPAMVLITGGYDENGNPRDTAELYDPLTNRFTPLANSMTVARAGHNAVLLRSGKVLILGGVEDAAGNAASFLDTAEIYDPVTQEFTLVEDPGDPGAIDKKMISPRADACALVLPADETKIGEASRDETDLVLVVGGRDQNGALKSIEIFDALTETFLATDAANDMAEARFGLSLSATMDGTYAAVAAGGMASPPKDTIEVFDQASRTWMLSLVKMVEPRAFHTGILMGDGRILMAGGQTDTNGDDISATADLYNLALEAQTRAVYDDPDTPADESMTDTPAGEVSRFIDVPNGELPSPNRMAAATLLNNGFVALFGGDTPAGATSALQLFAPDQGFNTAPAIEIRSPDANTPEPWAFGVRIYYRLVDAEGDAGRIVAQYKVLDSNNPNDATKSGDWLTTRKDDIGKWLPATMQANTVLGDASSGTSGLVSRMDEVDSGSNPIDNPDATSGADKGEHLFIWNSSLDIPKGDYDNVFFRLIAYGAVQGETASTSRFGMTKNAPVILRIQKPVQQQISGIGSVHGNIVLPFFVQDSDSAGTGVDDLARIAWEYGVDTDGDGKVIEQRDDQGDLIPGSERWLTATQSPLDVTLNGVLYQYEDQTTLTSASSGNPDANGYPRGVLHHFIWDSVYDLGAPVKDPVTGKYSRTDILIRGRPFDYPDQGAGNNPADAADQSSGIGMERAHDATDFPFEIERDPEGLWIDDWYPTTNGSDNTAPYMFNGVKVDEPIRFEFTGLADQSTINKNTLIVKPYGGGSQIAGFYHVQEIGGRTVVDFWPQAQEKPARTDVLVNTTGYSLEIPAYDPEDRSRAIIQRKGAAANDTNAVNILTDGSEAMAFKTGTGALVESDNPGYESMPLPTTSTDVSVGTKTVELRFDERLDPLSITPASFEVYAETFTGVKTVIPGTVLLSNKVDLTGTGGSLAKYGILSVALPSNMTLPPGSKIVVVVKTGVTDLAGNALSAQVMPNFQTVASTATNADSETEGFSTNTYLDTAGTTAAWGTANGTFNGNAVNGYLMGLFEYGDGSDGALTAGTTLTSSSTQTEWNFTSFNLPSGHTLSLRGTRPINIRVQGPMTINGTISGQGLNGLSGTRFTSTSGTNMRDGGAGVAGGGNGGGTGKYTSGQSSLVKGSSGSSAYGFTGGGGGAATGKYLASYVTYYVITPGGGGAGHGATGTAGSKGYPYWRPAGPVAGTGGGTFGDAGLSKGAEAGAGGGAGANVTAKFGWTGCVSGGSGGGGGAALNVYALGKITLGSSGKINCKGGNGGNGYYYYYWGNSNRYNGGGGGGGGSGGTAHLTAPDFDFKGTIDVSGGSGGGPGSPTTSYPNQGGAGSGGRIKLSTSVTMWMKSGVVTTGTSEVVCGGNYTTDWTINSSIKVNTDTGLTGIYDKTSGEFRVKNFTLAAGAVMTVTGTKPLKIIASGNVDIKGTIVAEGGSAARYPERKGYETYQSNRSTWYFWYEITYSYYKPGPTWGAGGPGGGTGGNNGSKKTLKSFYGWYSSHSTGPMTAQAGTGWDGKVGGKGAGLGGKANYKSYSRYRYYYYAGAGAGGTCASPGGKGGWSNYNSTYGGGTPGKAQVTSGDLIDLSTKTPYTVVGGAGGAGGAVGGRKYQSGSYVYNYPYGTGAGGGGGGGGVGICAGGTATVGGTWLLGGGDGGGHIYSTNSAYEGAGGAGSGGNLLVHATKGITFAGPVIDTGGGLGGFTKIYTYSWYSNATLGGDGGPGAMRFTQPAALGAPKLPVISLDPSKFLLGGGSISSGGLSLSTDAVSKFFDSVALAPKNFKWTAVDNGAISEFYLQGAQSDPLTGAADNSNTSAWVKLGSSTTTSVLNGYRYFRFKVILKPVLGDYPEIDSVTVHWEYDS